MYEITIREIETGEITQAKTNWVTAQWSEGENVAAVSLGKGDSFDMFRRCHVMEKELRRMLDTDNGAKLLWKLRDEVIQEETVLDLGKLKEQMEK